MANKKAGGANEAYNKIQTALIVLEMIRVYLEREIAEQEIRDIIYSYLKENRSNYEIIKEAMNVGIYTPHEVESMIMDAKKARMRTILENYRGLNGGQIGIDYSGMPSYGGMPKDVPDCVVLKIVIEQALEQLYNVSWQYAKVIEMMYISDEYSFRTIVDVFEVSPRMVYYWVETALEEMVYCMEPDGWSVQLERRLTNMLLDREEAQKFIDETFTSLYPPHLKKYGVIHNVA